MFPREISFLSSTWTKAIASGSMREFWSTMIHIHEANRTWWENEQWYSNIDDLMCVTQNNHVVNFILTTLRSGATQCIAYNRNRFHIVHPHTPKTTFQMETNQNKVWGVYIVPFEWPLAINIIRAQILDQIEWFFGWANPKSQCITNGLKKINSVDWDQIG